MISKKRHIISKPARASLWYISASALARGVGVLGTPLFTRLLSPSEYGLFPLYNSWLSLFSVVATLGMTGGITIAGLGRFSDRRDEYVTASVGLLFTVWGVITALYFIFSPFINLMTGLPSSLNAIMMLQIVSMGVTSLYESREKYSYRYKRASVLTVISSLSSPLLSALIIIYTESGGGGRIFGALLASLISSIPILSAVLRASSRLYDKEIWLYILRRAIPLLPHYVSSAIILRIGEVATSRIHGTDALGKYSVALSLGLSLSVVTGGLISAVGPWVIRKLKAENTGAIREILTESNITLALFSLLVLSFVPEAIRLLTPIEYHDCLIAVYPLSLSMIPSFISAVLTQGEMYYSKSAIMNVPTLAAAGVSAILSITFLPLVDYRFSALFVLIAYVTMAIINIFIFKRISGEMPLDPQKCALIFAVSLLYASILSLARFSIVTRIVLSLPLVPLLLIEAVKIYRIVKEK